MKIGQLDKRGRIWSKARQRALVETRRKRFGKPARKKRASAETVEMGNSAVAVVGGLQMLVKTLLRQELSNLLRHI